MLNGPITLTELWIYPIKSCRGTSASEALVGPRGIAFDRSWMVVTPDGTFLTQRQAPRLALVAPSVRADHLSVRASGMPPLALSLQGAGEPTEVVVWRDRCAAIDQGVEAAAWFSAVVGRACRLVRLDDRWVRPVDPTYAVATDQVGFADGFPFLLAAEASLADLNRRLPTPVPMDRFRPNLVIAGAAPYAEDRWRRIRIGELQFRVAKPCARCVTTTVDQDRGVVNGPEPLATLARYRLRGTGAMFGQNLLHDGPGRLQVGGRVQILEEIVDQRVAG